AARAAARRQAPGISARFRQRRESRGTEIRRVKPRNTGPRPGGKSRPPRTRHAPGAETLAQAAIAVHAVAHQGRSSDAALEGAQSRADRAAVRAIALGTL